MSPSVWSPDQYLRFCTERSQPFFDLLALIEPRRGMRMVDLGCGTGELTQQLHLKLEAKETLGVDNSATMLERSRAFAGSGLRFQLGDLAQFRSDHDYDVIFSNAALQWVPHHASVLTNLTESLTDVGQIAIQMPENSDHPSHVIAGEIAREEPFLSLLGGFSAREALLAPEAYALLLHHLGYQRQNVHVRIYVHVLESTESVIEWTKGTLLTDYQKRLSAASYDAFLDRYRDRLLARLGDHRPYPYTFKRVLMWATR